MALCCVVFLASSYITCSSAIINKSVYTAEASYKLKVIKANSIDTQLNTTLTRQSFKTIQTQCPAPDQSLFISGNITVTYSLKNGFCKHWLSGLSRRINLWSTIKATFWCKWVEFSRCRHVLIGCLACPQSTGEHQWNSSDFHNEQKVCWKHEAKREIKEKTKKEMVQMERGGGPYRKWPLSQKKNQCLTSLVVTFIAKCHSIWDLFSKANKCHCFIFSFFNHLILPFPLTVSKKQYPASVESFVRMRFFHENENKYKNSLIQFKS